MNTAERIHLFKMFQQMRVFYVQYKINFVYLENVSEGNVYEFFSQTDLPIFVRKILYGLDILIIQVHPVLLAQRHVLCYGDCPITSDVSSVKHLA